MSDLFKAISGGFARFVFAWVLPTLIGLGLFALVALPEVQPSWALSSIRESGVAGGITAAVVFSFAVLTLSVLLAYASLPIYQVLEGYSLPKSWQRPMIRRHRRERARLRALEARFKSTGVLPQGLDLDRMRTYPDAPESVRATSLGNALTALEGWSLSRYHLDSQTMWYEILGVSSQTVRQNTEEARAPVDFFVSAIANACILAAASLFVALTQLSAPAAFLAVFAAASIPLSYRLAVRNVLDWTQSVKAMVNLSRPDLAKALGLTLPQALEGERAMWASHYYAIEWNHAEYRATYDYYRVPPVPPPSS